jgi:hypothetical protein
VLLAECGSHAVVGLEISRYDVSEVHGAHRLLEQVGPDMLVMVDAGITSGGFVSMCVSAERMPWGPWKPGRGNSWPPTPPGGWLGAGLGGPTSRSGPLSSASGMWVRIISYRLTDERLGEVGTVYRLVTTLLNPRVAPALDADRPSIMSAGKSNW